ncbi:DUF4296 domain-containing protein [Hymenobacter sp. BT491]|uniref:DUF4296 domain-containing protein n=1 Tax=Hymenobacter sp. BT491 TaxID=2766779 RepID=UPI0016534B21|nr:DUF4296 domain-containing protein [Hymenobacter sp. BT491]MBC6989326.1 DUF4296 domain-containing protein [Hymenobacter sp. BT491]
MKKLPAGFLLFLSLALACCQRPEEPTPPARLLPKEQMESLLTELHILEARVDAVNLPQDSARALYNTLQKEVFQRRGITDSVFKQSYRYYAIHNKDLDNIYGSVIDSLTKREEKARAATQAKPLK